MTKLSFSAIYLKLSENYGKLIIERNKILDQFILHGKKMMAESESTKEKILIASIRLFSQHGYNEVTMRSIAKAVGIQVPSIYNHFESKKAILDAIYEYYDEQWNEAKPDIDELLRMAEVEPPDEVLMKMLFDWKSPEIQEMMNRIYNIASREAMNNSENMDQIKVLVMDRVKLVPRILLERLMELDKIEPIDIEAFVTILSHLSHSATALNLTPLKIDADEWSRCWKMLLSVVKPTGK